MTGPASAVVRRVPCPPRTRLDGAPARVSAARRTMWPTNLCRVRASGHTEGNTHEHKRGTAPNSAHDLPAAENAAKLCTALDF